MAELCLLTWWWNVNNVGVICLIQTNYTGYRPRKGHTITRSEDRIQRDIKCHQQVIKALLLLLAQLRRKLFSSILQFYLNVDGYGRLAKLKKLNGRHFL